MKNNWHKQKIHYDYLDCKSESELTAQHLFYLHDRIEAGYRISEAENSKPPPLEKKRINS